LESGLGEKKQPEIDLLSSLKQPGANLFHQGVGQAKQVVAGKVKQATAAIGEQLKVDKLTSLFDKDKPKK